jgi:membrane protein DedA with SNARE-associated domain
VSRTPQEQALVRHGLTALGVLSICGLTGSAFSLYLVNHFPLLLVALSPIGRHLVLVAPIVDPVAFVGVAVARRLLSYLACYLTGRGLGPTGVEWLEARAARFARFVRWVERLFLRAPHAVVFVMAGPTVSGLAGMTGMHPAAFVPLAVASLTLRMLFVLAFAEWLREPIEWLLARIDEYWVPGTVVMVVGALLYPGHRIRRARARAAELAA